MRPLAILAFAAFAAGGCAKTLGPKDVELTINTAASVISDADVGSVTALELTLSGTHSDHTRYDLTRAFRRQETLVIHLTSATGDLTVGVLARDAQGLVVAVGNTKSALMGSEAHLVAVDLGAPPDGTHATSAVALQPGGDLQLFAGQTVPLSSSSPVTWAVTAGGVGGEIDDNGLYTAPTAAGSDEVVASSAVYFGEKRSTTIGVLTTGVLRWAGLPAGAGTLDGIGPAARLAYVNGIAPDGSGNAFFSDGSNVIRKVDGSGAVTTIAGTIENPIFADGTGAAAGFGAPRGVALDLQRNALYVGDNTTVRKVDLATRAVTTLAGAPGMRGSVDGTGSAAQFEEVWGVAYDGHDHLFVTDAPAGQVRVIDVATGAVTTVAGIADMNGYQDGAGATAKFTFPTCIALDGVGHAFVGENNMLVRQIDLASKTVSTLAGKLNAAGNDDGPPGVGTLNYPGQLAYAGGTLYLSGRSIDVASGTITTRVMGGGWAPIDSLGFASDGTLWAGGFSFVQTVDPMTFALTPVAGVPITYDDLNRRDGSRWEARFNDIVGVTVAPDGTVMVRDNSSVRHIDLAAGTAKAVYTSDYQGGGNIAVDTNGDIYFPVNTAIYRLLASEHLSTAHLYAGSATAYGSTDGTLTQARFSGLSELVIAGRSLYIPDTGNNVIRAIDLDAGTVSTLAGTANMGGLVDMPGAAARFNGPQGVTSDGNGSLYVVSNNAVRKIVIAGALVSTIAGGDLPGYADGSGSAAKFNAPTRIAWDKTRSVLFVGDLKNTAIRKVTPAGAVTTVAGAPGKPYLAPGALPAAINEPTAIAVAPSGDVLVAVLHEQALLQIRLP